MYRWYAKNRHGVHSPFVYTFVEQILNGKSSVNKELNLPVDVSKTLSLKQQFLLLRILSFYKLSAIVFNDKEIGFETAQSPGRLYILENNISSRKFDKSDIVVLLNIYKDKQKNATWKAALRNENVSLSIDLFEAGVLFYAKEFKIKQHFILRY